MLREGWSGNMRSAVKLYQSISISGPSATENPIVRKSASTCSCARVMGCSPPRELPRPGSVTSTDSAPSFESRSAARILSRTDWIRASTSAFARLIAAPALGRSSAESFPRLFSSSVSWPALPRKRDLACSRSASVAVERMALRAASMICSSSFIRRSKRKGALASPSFSFSVLSGPEARFGLLDDTPECGFIENGEVGEDLAIDLDTGFLQARHELAVRHSRCAGARVDAGDPQRAEITLLVAAVAVGVLPRAHHRFLGDLEYVLPAAAITLGLVEDLLVARARRDSTFYARHVGGSLGVGKHRLHVAQVGRIDPRGPAQLTLVLG